jgi:hypothetical protein
MSITFVSGTHWSKTFIKGLEEYSVYQKRDHLDEDPDLKGYTGHGYSIYKSNRIPEGQIFTIFDQVGSNRGVEQFNFIICISTTDQDEIYEYTSLLGVSAVKGHFREIVRGDTVTKAKRLLDWWNEAPEYGGRSEKYANWCAQHIEIRGLKKLPPIPIDHVIPTKNS